MRPRSSATALCIDFSAAIGPRSASLRPAVATAAATELAGPISAAAAGEVAASEVRAQAAGERARIAVARSQKQPAFDDDRDAGDGERAQRPQHPGGPGPKQYPAARDRSSSWQGPPDAGQSFDLRAAESGRKAPEIVLGRALGLATGSHPLKRDDAQIGGVLGHRVARVLVEEASEGVRRAAVVAGAQRRRRGSKVDQRIGRGRRGGRARSASAARSRRAPARSPIAAPASVVGGVAGVAGGGSGTQTSPGPMSTAGRPRRRSTTRPSSTATRVVSASSALTMNVVPTSSSSPSGSRTSTAVALPPRDRHGSAGPRAGA